MKKYEIEIKNSVHDFIWELWEYVFRNSFSFESSKRCMDEIYKEIFSLVIFPNRCLKFNEKYKVLTINKKYRVFFIVDEKKGKVTVSRIFSSYEDYEEEF